MSFNHFYIFIPGLLFEQHVSEQKNLDKEREGSFYFLDMPTVTLSIDLEYVSLNLFWSNFIDGNISIKYIIADVINSL